MSQNQPQDCQSSFLARMHILSALPMKYTHFASSKSSKISQKQLKKHEMHKLGKRKASEVDFWRFLMILGVPRGGQKSAKIKKMPSENRSKKRRQKRRRCRQSVVECGGVRAACRNARFLLQEDFCHDSWGQSIHATTPGGVRRISMLREGMAQWDGGGASLPRM